MPDIPYEEPKISINRVRDEVMRITDMNTADKGFMEAVVLFSSAFVGPNIKRLAQFTGYTRKQINKISKRARQQEIWIKHRICADWFNEKYGGINFNTDLCVILGWLDKVRK